MLARKVKDVDVLHEEFLEWVLVVWLFVFIHNQRSIFVIVYFCNYSLTSSNFGDDAKSEVSEFLTLLQNQRPKICLSRTCKQIVKLDEWTSVIIQIQDFVSKHVLVHNKCLLHLFGDLNDSS